MLRVEGRKEVVEFWVLKSLSQQNAVRNGLNREHGLDELGTVITSCSPFSAPVRCLFVLYSSFGTIDVERLGQFGMLSGIHILKGSLGLC